jgi:ABC-type amino acid transport substrate-binding protein
MTSKICREPRGDRLIGLATLALALLLQVVAARAGTLDTIRQTQIIRFAYRGDAPPFSVKGRGAEPTGYIVELCRAVAASLTTQLNLSRLNIVYVPVTAANRFDAIQQGNADLLCEATSETLDRRKVVDFSIPTFVDGASLLIQSGGPTNIAGLAGLKVGVLGGTTTEQALRNTLKAGSIDATVVLANTHEGGLEMLEAGAVSAYFADRAILQYLQLASKAPEKLSLADNYLTVELYALALPHGDEDFRLAVDTALSQIYRSGDIVRIFHTTFGSAVEPSTMVKTLYLISGLQP